MNQEKVRIGIIFGGRSGEHEISLQSARSVLSVLDLERYAVTQILITHEGSWRVADLASPYTELADLSPAVIFGDPSWPGLYTIHKTQHGHLLELLTSLDVVFPILHGTFGEDGTLQGLLEMADVAYVGAGVLGSSLGMDKGVFHAVMRACSIPVLETMVVLRKEIERDLESVLERAEQLAPYPLFTKPANLGSSVGVSKCQDRADLVEGLIEAARYDRRILIQRGLRAREIEVAVLGNDDPQASVAGEVIPSRDFYSYEAKYLDDASQLLIPAPVPAEVAEKARKLAVEAYRAIDCAGMARVDFLLDKDSGELYLNEVNTIPGFTKISMYPKLWEASGLPYPALVDRLVELAFERKADRDRNVRRYAEDRGE